MEEEILVEIKIIHSFLLIFLKKFNKLYKYLVLTISSDKK